MYQKMISLIGNGNRGERAENSVSLAFTGKEHKKDSVRFDKGSDIEELKMSVKSNHATLVSGGILKATEKQAMINEYLDRDASDKFAYVCDDGMTYIMNKDEFEKFINEFVTLDRDSKKNGGQIKLRLKAESSKMRAWLESAI